MSSKRRISRISKRTKKTINTKMTYPIKDYHIIENQKLDISLLNKNNSIYMNDFKYIPNEYIEFLKKCYKINNSKFPYTIINNKFPKDYHVYMILENYICKKSEIYQKNRKGQKENYLTKELYQSYLEDDYNDNVHAITILYFHNVPEEIGKLEIKFYKAVERIGWRQDFYGSKHIELGKHIIKSGTVVIINANTLYKFTVENKLATEYNLPIIKFSGSIEYPLPKY